MSTTRSYPAPVVRRTAPPDLRPLARFRWQARRLSLDAVTGQVGTLTRASTSTAVDGLAATITVGHSMPRWEARDWAASGSRDTMGLRLSTDDLIWPCNFSPEDGTLYIEFSEEGTRAANVGLLYVGNDAQTGARLYVDATGGNYRATIHNGTTSQSVTLTGSTPTSGQMCKLLVELDDDGTNQRVKLTRQISGVDTVTAYSATVTRASAWGTTAYVRVNRLGSAGTQGNTWIRDVAWFPGLKTMTECGYL